MTEDGHPRRLQQHGHSPETHGGGMEDEEDDTTEASSTTKASTATTTTAPTTTAPAKRIVSMPVGINSVPKAYPLGKGLSNY